jgi:hypothetical protein
VFDRGYETIDNDFCVYCGGDKECLDHIPPICLAHLNEGPYIKVPACNECNKHLFTFNEHTIEKRKKYLFQRLRKKHKKLLNMPDWDSSEFKDMDVSLVSFIKKELRKKEIVHKRMEHLNTWQKLEHNY